MKRRDWSRGPATPLQFVPPLAMALFFVTMIFLYGDLHGQQELLRMEVAGIFILATIGGWGLGEWIQSRKQPAGSHESKP